METKDLKHIKHIIDNIIVCSKSHDEAIGMLKTLERWLETFHPLPIENVKIKISGTDHSNGTGISVRKIEAIKETRAISGLGLKESKDLIELGGWLPVDLPLDKAQKFQSILAQCGVNSDILGGPAVNVLFGNNNA